MDDATKHAITIFQELGALAFLIIVGAIAFGFLVWKIAAAQERIADKLNDLGNVFSTHHQNALDMHSTCRIHGDQISYLHKGMVEFKTEVNDEISDLSKEVAVLKERIG